MTYNLVKTTTVFLLLLCMITDAHGQTDEDLKRQKLAEKEQLLKIAKQRAAQEVFVVGYTGGVMAPYGFTLYTTFPDKAGFYSHLRSRIAGAEKILRTDRKDLNLVFGFTQNLFFPVALYAAAGISDFTPAYGDISTWEFGLDTSFGLIFHVNHIELQSGISLFNFRRPEFCFGFGMNIWRRK